MSVVAADPSVTVPLTGRPWLPGVETKMSSSELVLLLLGGVGLTVSTPSLMPVLLEVSGGVVAVLPLLVGSLVVPPEPVVLLLLPPGPLTAGIVLLLVLLLALLCRKAAESRRLASDGKLVPLAAILLVL